MQRQSLGSAPAPKLHIHGANKIDDNNILLAKDLLSPSLNDDIVVHQDSKATKPRRFSSASLSPNAEKVIHLVPLLTLFCLLVLYLVSHNPTQTDLSQFNGFKRISSGLESSSETVVDERGDVSEIRNLQQEMSGGADSSLKSRSHRKVADF